LFPCHSPENTFHEYIFPFPGKVHNVFPTNEFVSRFTGNDDIPAILMDRFSIRKIIIKIKKMYYYAGKYRHFVSNEGKMNLKQKHSLNMKIHEKYSLIFYIVAVYCISKRSFILYAHMWDT
jgi:hypothetical protein